MAQVLEAVFEHGAFRPLTPPGPGLTEGQQVHLVVETLVTDHRSAAVVREYAGIHEQSGEDLEHI